MMSFNVKETELVRKCIPINSTITTYVDNQAALKALKGHIFSSYLVRECKRVLSHLMFYYQIRLCWLTVEISLISLRQVMGTQNSLSYFKLSFWSANTQVQNSRGISLEKYLVALGHCHLWVMGYLMVMGYLTFFPFLFSFSVCWIIMLFSTFVSNFCKFSVFLFFFE